MRTTTGKPKGITPAVTRLSGPAPRATKHLGGDGIAAGPVKAPALGNRQPAVPPLKLAEKLAAPEVTSPDRSPPSSPMRSPLKSPLKAALKSPQQMIRSFSEKASAAASRLGEAVSPRPGMAEFLQDVVWMDFSDSQTSAHAPSPEPAPSRKRKAESDGNLKEAKKVRFETQPQAMPVQDGTSGAITDYKKQIDELSRVLAEPFAPPTRPKTAAPNELTPIQLPFGTGFDTPSLGKRLAGSVPGSRKTNQQQLDMPPLPPLPTVSLASSMPAKRTSGNRVAPDPGLLHQPATKTAASLTKDRGARDADERKAPQAGSPDSSTRQSGDYPFAPNRIGRQAIKKRAEGRKWVDKATGDSLAATLQRTLDGLKAANASSIGKEACGYLEELFGLLPAGVNKGGKTFERILMKTFYHLGLTHAQWDSIERLHEHFDQLDTRHDPAGCAAFKSRLGEILATKQALASARQDTHRSEKIRVQS